MSHREAVAQATIGQRSGIIGCAKMVFTGQPDDFDNIGIGVDTYEFAGVGGNINVAKGGTAAGTLTALVAAINASGTETLLAVELGVDLMIYYADIAGGTPIVGTPTSIALTESIVAAANIWDRGNVNEEGYSEPTHYTCGSITATALNIVGTMRMKLPFTAISARILYKEDSAAAWNHVLTSATVAVNGTDGTVLDFVLGAGGTPVVNTDLVEWEAFG